jgi:hypothetical protein
MKKDLIDNILGFIICIGIVVIALIIFGYGCLYGEDNLIQKLCTQQQYDFCEVIEQKPEYTLKELKLNE